MTAHDDIDDRLRERFARLREADASEAPPFAEMIARARARASQEGPVADSTESVGVVPRTRGVRRRWPLAAIPIAIAAGVAFLFVNPDRAADREFERVVSEWSRTERALSTPTDGLLAVPGSEYLRRLPPFVAGSGANRRPS